MKKFEKIFNILFSLLLLIALGLYLYRGPSLPKTRGTLQVIPLLDMLDSSIEVPVAIMIGFEFPEERVNYLLKGSESMVLLTRESLVDGMNIQSKDYSEWQQGQGVENLA